jgi:tRNA-dihydrouridine synthase A
MQHHPPHRLSVAPMMDWTDRHCRYFHRQMSARALLYTEMVTAQAVTHGDPERLLGHDPAEHPLALQLGGSDPALLARAVEIAVPFGFAEVNLNVGCPSDRVQSGCFGAALMRRPGLVAECLAAMRAAAPAAVAVTLKCRIGVDDQDPEAVLPDLLARAAAAGVSRVAIHARKAWLQGLSPKQNREIPPLDHALVHRMKRAFPGLAIVLNGGIDSLDAALGHLAAGLDGVMIGRAAYQSPASILLAADRRVFGDPVPDRTPEEVAAAMRPYIARHLAAGGRLHGVTRHMLGLFAGRPGARAWRQVLSARAHEPGAGLEVLDAALAAVARAAPAAGPGRAARGGRGRDHAAAGPAPAGLGS